MSMLTDLNAVTIWNSYIDTYGKEPADATQLLQYSKITDDVDQLSYKQARQIFTSNKGKGKINFDSQINGNNVNQDNIESKEAKPSDNTVNDKNSSDQENSQQQQDENKEISKYEQLCQQNPDNIDDNIKYGILLCEAKQYDKAEQQLLKCLKMTSFNYHLFMSLFAVYKDTNQLNKAEIYAAKLIQMFPDDPNANTVFAQTMYSLKRYDLAIKYGKNAMKSDPGNQNHIKWYCAYINTYCDLLIKNEQYEEAEKCLREITELKPENLSIWKKYGQIMTVSNKLSTGIELCKKMIKKYPKNWRWYNRAGVFYSIAYNPEEALNYYKKAVDLEANSHSVVCNYARCLNKLKQYNSAKSFLKSYLNDDKHPFYYKYVYVTILIEEGKYDEAECYLETLSECKDYNEIKFFRAISKIKMLKKEYEEASHYILKWINLSEQILQKETNILFKKFILITSPNHVPAYCWHGRLLMKLNRAKESENEFIKCLSLHENYADGHYYYAILLMTKLNHPNDAIKHLKHAIKINPENDEYLQKLHEYSNINFNTMSKTNDQDDDIKHNEEKKNDAADYGNIKMIMDTKGHIGGNIMNDNVEDTLTVDRCKTEFERFLSAAVVNGVEKYLIKFKEAEMNDIRYIGYLDDDTLKTDVGITKTIHRKMLLSKVRQYLEWSNKFKTWLKTNNMDEKHSTVLEEHGICTFWSFYHYIKSANDLQKILKNKSDASILWNTLGDQSELAEGQ